MKMMQDAKDLPRAELSGVLRPTGYVRDDDLTLTWLLAEWQADPFLALDRSVILAGSRSLGSFLASLEDICAVQGVGFAG